MAVIYDKGLQRLAEARDPSDIMNAADVTITQRGEEEGDHTSPRHCIDLGLKLGVSGRPVYGVRLGGESDPQDPDAILLDDEPVQIAFFVGTAEQVQRRIESIPAAGDEPAAEGEATEDPAPESNHDQPDDPRLGFRVEWDPTYFGGDYDKQGNFLFLPDAYVALFGDDFEEAIMLAFEELTGQDQQHVVHYTGDAETDGDITLWLVVDRRGVYPVQTVAADSREHALRIALAQMYGCTLGSVDKEDVEAAMADLKAEKLEGDDGPASQ